MMGELPIFRAWILTGPVSAGSMTPSTVYMQTVHVVLVNSADHLANPTRLGDNLAGLWTKVNDWECLPVH
jgi:hypothetical protein